MAKLTDDWICALVCTFSANINWIKSSHHFWRMEPAVTQQSWRQAMACTLWLTVGGHLVATLIFFIYTHSATLVTSQCCIVQIKCMTSLVSEWVAPALPLFIRHKQHITGSWGGAPAPVNPEMQPLSLLFEKLILAGLYFVARIPFSISALTAACSFVMSD